MSTATADTTYTPILTSVAHGYYRVERENLAFCLLYSTITTLTVVNLFVAFAAYHNVFARFKLVDTVVLGGLDFTGYLTVALIVAYAFVVTNPKVRHSVALSVEAIVGGLSLLVAYIAYNSVFMHLA